MKKSEQRCSGFFLCRKINAPRTGAESEEENESYQSAKYERRCSQVIYGSKYGI